MELGRKRGLLSETNLKVAAALLSLFAAISALLGHQPKGFMILVGVAALIFVLSLLPFCVSSVRRALDRHSARRYVARECLRLRRFYDRLIPFTSQNDGRSFRCMLYNASTSQNTVVTTILGFDYIPSWIECYGAHLKTTPGSVLEFLQRCNELTTIVAGFNRNYVIKAQQGLEKTPFQQDHFTDQFEQFREEFAHYLRELEDWVNSLNAEAEKRVPNLLQHRRTWPTSIFERAKSFKRKNAVGQQ